MIIFHAAPCCIILQNKSKRDKMILPGFIYQNRRKGENHNIFYTCRTSLRFRFPPELWQYVISSLNFILMHFPSSKTQWLIN